MRRLTLSLFATILLLAGSAINVAAVSDHPPVLRVPVMPKIPPELRKEGAVKGYAVIEFSIRADGSVTNPRVVKSSNSKFGQAAMEAVLRWKYSPGIKNGHPVVAKTEQRLEYDLTNDSTPAQN